MNNSTIFSHKVKGREPANLLKDKPNRYIDDSSWVASFQSIPRL